MKNILLTALTFLLGGMIGSASGFNFHASGAVFTGLSAIAFTPKGAMRVNPDLSEVTTQLGDYFRRFSREIWVQILKGVDFEQYMVPVPGQTSQYVTTNSSRTEFLQPWQKGFQAKGGVALLPYINQVFHIKMDTTLDNLHELWNTYLAELQLADEKRTPDQWPFVQWLVNYHIIPGVTEELRIMSVIGVNDAPTPGTPGASIDSANGIFTIIANEITASNLTPLVTGAITSANVVDKLEQFHKDLPHEYQGLPGIIFCSHTMLTDYKYGYRDAFAQNVDFKGPTIDLWGTSKMLVGLPALNGSSRILYTPTGPTGNLLKMYNQLIMPTPTVQLEKRDVHLLSDFHRGWGFKTLEAVFVNDQV